MHNRIAYNSHQKLAKKLHLTQLEEILLHMNKITVELNKNITLEYY